MIVKIKDVIAHAEWAVIVELPGRQGVYYFSSWYSANEFFKQEITPIKLLARIACKTTPKAVRK